MKSQPFGSLELRNDPKWSMQDIGDVVINFQYRYIASEPLAQVVNQLKREMVVFASPKCVSPRNSSKGKVYSLVYD